jgi:hypothetical protein
VTDLRGVPAEVAEAVDASPDGVGDELEVDQPDEEFVDLIDEPAADASDVADPTAVASIEDLPDDVPGGDISAIEPEEI